MIIIEFAIFFAVFALFAGLSFGVSVYELNYPTFSPPTNRKNYGLLLESEKRQAAISRSSSLSLESDRRGQERRVGEETTRETMMV